MQLKSLLTKKISVLPLVKASCLAGMLIFSGTASLPGIGSAAFADDEVEVICWDMTVGNTETVECETVENLKAECEVSDPESTSDVCQDANAASISKPSRPQLRSNMRR